MDELRFQCGFCGRPIEHQEPIECSVRLADGGTQRIWCHVDCFRARLDPGVPFAAVLEPGGAPPGVMRLTSRDGRSFLELSEIAGDDRLAASRPGRQHLLRRPLARPSAPCIQPDEMRRQLAGAEHA